MEFITLTSNIEDEWDSMVFQSDDGWAFSLSYWLIMVTPVWQLENYSFAVVENGRMVALMPLHLYPTLAWLSSSGWGHGGPVVLRGVSEKNRKRLFKVVWKHTLEIATQIGATRITASLSPLSRSSLKNRWGINPLVECGAEDVSTQTYIIDLSREESGLWSGLSQDARQQIKKARSAGYVVERCSWKEMLEAYYRIHVETYYRTGVNPHPRSYFEGIAASAWEKHSVLWVGRDTTGRPVAFHNDTRFGETAMYHTGCSETAYIKSGINYLLFWEAIIGAKQDECAWYESGEAFPQARTGKEKGLTVFKRKFGGELHRVFRGVDDVHSFSAVASQSKPYSPGSSDVQSKACRRFFLRNWLRTRRDLFAPIIGFRLTATLQRIFFVSLNMARRLKKRIISGRINPITKNQSPEGLANRTRSIYSEDNIYSIDRITILPPSTSTTYAHKLLLIRLELVRKFADGSNVLDLCCATGGHLLSFAECMQFGVGIDFSLPFVKRADSDTISREVGNAQFVCGDITRLPLCGNYFDIVYCFSSLYQIPNINEVIREIARVLKTGGKCSIDMGNLYSINTVVCNAYPELPYPCHIPVSMMIRLLNEADLVITEHRAFQLLPMWGDRPKWLKPILWSGWTRILGKQIRGKMLDEWISSLPLLKHLAFRHVFVCEKK